MSNGLQYEFRNRYGHVKMSVTALAPPCLVLRLLASHIVRCYVSVHSVFDLVTALLSMPF